MSITSECLLQFATDRRDGLKLLALFIQQSKGKDILFAVLYDKDSNKF